MKAMVYRGPYKVRVEEKDMPRIEHPNDAIVRVTTAAICGSDLHLYHGMMPDTRVGMTFGHEFVGVVHEVGPSVERLKPGDRVMVPFNVYCGSCWFCARGLYSNCHNVNPNATAVGGIYGYSHTCGGYDGGQAEYVRVPFADVGPSIIPDWMDEEDAVLLTDALATGYFGAQLGDIAEGDTVVVLGAGPVGLYANCHNVNPNATAVGGIYGYSHTCGGYDGGQAEFVRVPFADVGPSLIPDWMDDEDAVLLTDAVATGYFGAQLGDIVEGDVVVVFGAGPVGLFAAKSAWFMGAGVSSSSTTSSTGWRRRAVSRTPRRTTSPSTRTSSCT